MRGNIHKPVPSPGKTFTQASQTIPNETMSMRTILERYAKGLPTADFKTPIFDEEEISQGINPKTLDLADWEKMSREGNDTIKAYERAKAYAEEQEKLKQTATEAAVIQP